MASLASWAAVRVAVIQVSHTGWNCASGSSPPPGFGWLDQAAFTMGRTESQRESVDESEHFHCSGVIAATFNVVPVCLDAGEMLSDVASDWRDGLHDWGPMRGGHEAACHCVREMEFDEVAECNRAEIT